MVSLMKIEIPKQAVPFVYAGSAVGGFVGANAVNAYSKNDKVNLVAAIIVGGVSVAAALSDHDIIAIGTAAFAIIEGGRSMFGDAKMNVQGILGSKTNTKLYGASFGVL